MYSSSVIGILCLVALVNGAAFNPLYRQKPSPGSKSPATPPIIRKRLLGVHNDTQDPRRYRKQPRWLPSGTGSRTEPHQSFHLAVTPVKPRDARPTPAPTGDPSPDTTIYITDENNFALIAPKNSQEIISDAEADGVSFCYSRNTPSDNKCSRFLPDGFITAVSVKRSDDGSWVQVTGCIDHTKFPMSSSDDGGQFDVRYPNGAQCAFGGYGASFIEQIEPSANRFCLRCCKSANDQDNCNSHQDRAGCVTAIPGVYNFPDIGVNCG